MNSDPLGKPRLDRRMFLRLGATGRGAAVLGACGGGAPAAPASSGGGQPAASNFDPAQCYRPFAGTAEKAKFNAKSGPYVIALSNSYIGNVWRTQMIKMAKAFAELPDVKPSIKQFLVNSSGNDAAAQIGGG